MTAHHRGSTRGEGQPGPAVHRPAPPQRRDTGGRGAWALLLAAALALGSCGDKADPPAVPDLPTASPMTPAPAATMTPVPSPTATPTPNPETERAAVVDAAAAALGGARYVSPLTLQACLEGNPQRTPCIELKTPPGQLARGIASFALGDPDGGASTFLMGRMTDGRWAFWRGSQQQSYLLETLPGQLLVCGSNDGAAIRAEPSASSAVIATPPNLAPLVAEELRLLFPGRYGVQGDRGEAWYRLTSPAAGWIDATQTTAAALGDCLLHDEVEQVDRG